LHEFARLGTLFILNGVQGVAGSNPAVPIEMNATAHSRLVDCGPFAFPVFARVANTSANADWLLEPSLDRALNDAARCMRPAR
jgi:hypothetical protein